MAIRCGNCKGQHETVTEVRACCAGGITKEAILRKPIGSLLNSGATELPRAPRREPVTRDGMYRDPSTGEIFKVQKAVHGSGNLYAKRLQHLTIPVTKRGKEIRVEFVYAPGAIRDLSGGWRLTEAEAIEFGRLYGCCVRCGAVLTREESIDRAMGPVCYGREFGEAA